MPAHTLGNSWLLLAAVCWADAPTPAPKINDLVPTIREQIDSDWPHLQALYVHLHRHPELSFQEVRTAARLAEELRSLDVEVTEKVGRTGLIGVLKNGDGPTIMIRTDLDALPVIEQTGLAYASKEQVRADDGKLVGVMHACGHDVHMTCWVGAARRLAAAKAHWRGTLLFVGQPAEERGAGAKHMLQDGLFQRFGKPHAALALHCDSFAPTGSVGFTEGMALANVDSVDIIVKGRGGHGSAPHTTVDPIVIAARLILDLQTIVSREVDPTDAAVVTVGSIHGGTKHNIIPAEVTLQLTVRTFKDSTRKHVLEAIERIARAAAAAARAPEPTVRIDLSEFTPAMVNDVGLTRRTVGALRLALGEAHVRAKPPVMGGEDFSQFGRAGVPICMLRIGTVAPDRFALFEAGKLALPSLHSDLYAPVAEPSIKTGVLAMTVAVLNLVTK
jgi:hippurate hydrolase